jgi:hypothetical protein
VFFELNPHERATVILALEAWAENRGRRADALKPVSPMLSVKVREECERAKALMVKVEA